MGFQKIMLYFIETGRGVFEHRSLNSRAAQHGLKRGLRLVRRQGETVQRKISGPRSTRGNHLYIESRIMQVECNALGRQLHRAAAFRAQRKWRRRESAMLFMGLFEVALGGEEEGVSGERCWQQAGGDLALFLKDYVGERAAINGQRNGRTQVGIGESAGAGNAEREERCGRRLKHCEPLVAGLAQLLGWNLNQIGAAHAQVEPLIANGAAHMNLDRIDKGPPLPAALVRSQR